MKKRNFMMALGSLIAMPSFAVTCTHAMGERFGVYELKEPIKGYANLTNSPTRNVTVVEFFWYGCGHCAALQPHMRAWLKELEQNKNTKGTPKVDLVRIPAVPRENWAGGAIIYYALVEAKVWTEALHAKIFEAIHEKNNNMIGDKAALNTFLVKEVGMGQAAKVMGLLESEAVMKNVKMAVEATKNYKLAGTPTLVVENQYLISPIEAKGTDKVIGLTKQVVEAVYTCKG